MRNWRYLPTVFASLALTACAGQLDGYRAPLLPQNQLAVIRNGPSETYRFAGPMPARRCANVDALDGVSVTPYYLDKRGRRGWEIAPGPHVVRVLHHDNGYFYPSAARMPPLRFTAKAGHVYEVYAGEAQNGRRVWWIQDVDSQAVIAGTRPSIQPGVRRPARLKRLPRWISGRCK